MSTFNFSTGNKYIDGKIEYSHTRYTDSYVVSYSVQMRRNNSWTGTHTHGKISYNVYLNGTSIKSATNQQYNVYNGGAWYTLVSGSHTVSLSADKSTNYSIGFSASTIDGISAFNVSYQATTPSSSNAISVSITPVGESSLTIEDTGKNSFKLTSVTGVNGVSNDAGNCYIIYTTNGVNPDINGGEGHHIIATGKSSGNTYTTESSIDKDTTVKAYTRTIGSQPGVYSYTDLSKIVEKNILHYAPPVWDMSSKDPVDILYYTPEGEITDTPQTDSTYVVSWDAAKESNSNSPVMGYKYAIYVNSEAVLEKWVNKDVRKFTFSKSNSTDHNISIQDNDVIAVTITPYTYWGDKTTKFLGESLYRPKENIGVKDLGMVSVKQSNGTWKRGQVWVKVKTENDSTPIWRPAKKIFIKTSSGWEESI